MYLAPRSGCLVASRGFGGSVISRVVGLVESRRSFVAVVPGRPSGFPGSAQVFGVITFCLRLGEAEIGFGPRRLALQLVHARGTRAPGAVRLGLVEVIPLAS